MSRSPVAKAPRFFWPRAIFCVLLSVYAPTSFVAWLGDGAPSSHEMGEFWVKVGLCAVVLVIWLCVMALLYLMLRRLLLPLFWIFVIVYSPFLSWNLVGVTNVRFDARPPSALYLRYVSHSSPSKGHSYDTLRLEGEQPYEFETYLELDEVDRIPGRRLRADLYAGYFGIPWITRPRVVGPHGD